MQGKLNVANTEIALPKSGLIVLLRKNLSYQVGLYIIHLIKGIFYERNEDVSRTA